MPVPCFQVDAFSHGPFTGNPAAVCLLPQEASPAWMQAVAAEMNLAETAFVSPLEDEVSTWKLRWFTPSVEVDLCGHATLGSACAMYLFGAAPADEPIVFLTASGTLSAQRASDGPVANDRVMKLELDFPECAPTATRVPAALCAALDLDIETAWDDGTDLLVELANEEILRSLNPDFVALGRIDGIRGLIVTSRSEDDRYDFASRFFAPAVGIDEDPVTGSAHCCLAPFWSQKLSKNRLRGYQASARGGVVEVELHTAAGGQRRVKLRGNAELIFRGELLVDPF